MTAPAPISQGTFEDIPPYVQLYPLDLLTDPRLAMLTPHAFGIYMRLLLTLWREQPMKLPADPKKIIRLIRGSPDDLEAVSEALEAFDVSPDGKSFTLSWLDALREQTRQRIETNRKNGKRGGRPPGS